MDDLSKMLNDILSTKEGRQGFEQAMQILNGAGNKDRGAKNDEPKKQEHHKNGDDVFIDPKQLLKIKKLMSSVPKTDKNTEFLKALKPLLKASRQKKVDEAIKMMRLFSLIPILNKSGLLKNFF